MKNNDLFDIEFDKKEKCWSVTGYYGKSEEVIFPASYKGKPVKKIVNLFSPNQRKRIKCAIIPEGYTSIGEITFEDCKGMTNIELPESLTSIGKRAFSGCAGLTNIKLPESLTSIGIMAFSGCTGLTNIKLPESLTSIGHVAFLCCEGLTNIRLPKSLTSIGEDAFYYCSGLTDIKLPKSLTSIGGRAFYYCTELTNIKLPEGLTSIGNSAFEGCKGLTNIKLPESLTSIGDMAFSGCAGLTNIKLPKSLASIGDAAFGNCKGLTNIELPKSLTSFGDRVFADCTGLTEITVDKDNSAFYAVDGAIFDKAMTTLILAPIGTKGVYSVPDGIVSITSHVLNTNRPFYFEIYFSYNDCMLTGISFPKSLLYVDLYMLDRINKQLTDITVSELNPVYCSVDGVLFDKDMSKLIMYPKNKDKKNILFPMEYNTLETMRLWTVNTLKILFFLTALDLLVITRSLNVNG